jgi:adenosylmethionine-8-amino-7-oxononanoate aminotransferase
LGDFNHGGTFSHHVIGTAAGLATLKIMQEENLVENSARQGEILGQLLKESFAEHPYIGDIRGRGLFWTLEIVQDRATKEPFPVEKRMAQTLWQHAFDNGLIIYYAQGCVDGRNGDLLHIGPPLIVTESQIREIVVKLEETISAVLSNVQV